jgi:hypothetical protein
MRPEYLTVPAATLVYLLVDIYPSVKSFIAILRTLSFWLLWLILSVLNIIALAAISVTAKPKLLSVLHDDSALTTVTLIILSTLGTLSVLQSFTIKISDYKFIDVGMLLEAYRKSVLSDIGDTVTGVNRRYQQRLADKLFTQYGNDRQRLRDEYATVMSFGGRTVADIGQELDQLEQQAGAAHLSVERMLTLRIAKADTERAEQLLSA